MPSYPDIFYYQEKNNTAVYSFTGPGEIDPIKFIQHKPYRKTARRTEDQHEKPLILTAAATRHYSREDKLLIKMVVRDLLEEGFTLYRWESNLEYTQHAAHPLTPENLYQLEDEWLLRCLKPSEKNMDIVNITAQQYHLNKDHLHVLNIETLVDLPLKERSIRPETYLIEQNFSAAKLAEDQQQLQHIKMLSSGNMFRVASETNLTAENINYIIQQTPKLQVLNLDSYPLAKNISTDLNFGNLDEVRLEFQYLQHTVQEYQHLFANTEKLKRVYIGRLSPDDIGIDINFSSLTHFELACSSPTASQVRHFLAHAAKLQILNLASVGQDEEIGTNLNLPSLEYLNLSGGITWSNLKSLVAHAKNLKSLVCDIAPMSDQKTDLASTLDLSALKYLKLHSEITSQDLIALLKAAPHLEELDIKGCNVDLNHPELKQLFKRIAVVKTKQPSAYETPVDQPHDPSENLSNQPTPDDFVFKYTRQHRSLDQKMFSEQCSQYLTLIQQHLNWIPRLQDGICQSLCALFKTKTLQEWTEMVNTIHAWDGRKESLTPQLENYFNEILHAFEQHHIKKIHRHTSTYVGLPIPLHIAKVQRCTLSNPWHDIELSYDTQNDHWILYNPNFVGGYKKIADDDELRTEIEQCLGTLVFMEGVHPHVQPVIQEADTFIHNGGLLALTQLAPTQAQPLLDQLVPHTLSTETLTQGLLLRNIQGTPAWQLGSHAKNPAIQNYTHSLLAQFKAAYPNDYLERLKNSIASKPEITSVANKTQPLHNPLQHEIAQMQQEQKEQLELERQFETWNTQKPEYAQTLAYVQHLISDTTKHRLVKLSSSRAAQGLSLQLQHYCQNTIKRPYFYIHSPDDIVCNAPFIAKESDHYISKPGPGGSLHDFLTQPHDPTNPSRVLIVNYDKFSKDDMVRLNTLIDKKRFADGTPIPDDIKLIGLINPNRSGCYQGKDFYSRFSVDNIERCPIPEADIMPHLAPITQASYDNLQNSYPIQLCHSEDWKERLCGRLVIQNDHLEFQPGILVEALQSGFPITLHNGLWDDPEFCYFWDQARTLGYVLCGEQKVDIAHVQWFKHEGYDWQNLNRYRTQTDQPVADALILNPSLWHDFFTRYHCNNSTQSLTTLAGYIAAHSGQTLNITLTTDLSTDEWGDLLTECAKHNVHLNYARIPTQSYTWDPNSNSSTNSTSSSSSSAGTTTIIYSSDPDTTVEFLKKQRNHPRVIDVSDMSSHDLLTRLNGTMNGEKFQFNSSEGILTRALNQREDVILTGRFSAELIDTLAPVLLQRQNNPSAPGNISIVTADPHAFAYSTVAQHHVTVAEKQQALAFKFDNADIQTLDAKLLRHEPLCRLSARLRYPKTLANSDPWQGLNGLSGGIHFTPFDEQHSAEKAAAFVQARKNAVNAILANSPYAFLTGLTSVGKSTFVENEFLEVRDHLFLGEEQLKAWATSTPAPGERAILFIDEANLSSLPFSILEGLMHEPPRIIIDDVPYPLSAQHKIIFAGNPLNYGEGRKNIEFLQRHGSAIIFDAMPPEFIYEKILKPVFKNTALEAHSLVIARELLSIYEFLCRCSKDKVLISPRELQMMALLILSHHDAHSSDNLTQTTQYYARTLAKHLVPTEHAHTFAQKFPPVTLPTTSIPKTVADLLVTESREPLLQHLHDLTALREYRIQHHAQLNNAQRYGGLGGLVIEGEPGIGKSELVVKYLVDQGYREVHWPNKNPTPGDKVFYRMPASMTAEEQEALVLHAADTGAWVIADEVNSILLPEKLLNNLLMGKLPADNKSIPDQQHSSATRHTQVRRPAYPGFTFIGTQNPITMAGGRRAPSPAIARRLVNTELKAYTTGEMNAILVHRGLPEKIATGFINAYLKKLEQARRQKREPEPCFRDLIDRADQWLAKHTTPLTTQSTIRHIYSTPITTTLNTSSNSANDIMPTNSSQSTAGTAASMNTFGVFTSKDNVDNTSTLPSAPMDPANKNPLSF